MGHVPRTHRADLDWLFERCQYDLAIKFRFVLTKDQMADMLTKGSFAAVAWQQQTSLWEIVQQRTQVPPVKAGGPTTKHKTIDGKLNAVGCWQHLGNLCATQTNANHVGMTTGKRPRDTTKRNRAMSPSHLARRDPRCTRRDLVASCSRFQNKNLRLRFPLEENIACSTFVSSMASGSKRRCYEADTFGPVV